MKHFVQFLEKYLSTPMSKLAAQRHFMAIRDGVVSAIPFIMIGSVFLILASPPFPEGNAIREWLLQYSAQIILPFRVTMFVMSFYVAFGIGHSLAKSYELDTLTGGVLAFAALLMTSFPVVVEDYGWVLPLADFGGAGLFVTMVVSVFAVELFRFCVKHNITVKMPEQVPEGVSRSFAAIFPAALLILIMGLVTVVLEIDLHRIMIQLVSPLTIAGDSLPGVLMLIFLITFFWAFGIHGIAVVGSIARPFWLMYSEANVAAAAAGEALPHVAPETFYQWFVWIGGAGATLGLLLASLIVARSQYLKTISRASFIPGLFNINEPVIFGMPVVLNPMLIIPFMLAPIVLAVISYVVTVIGWVTPTSVIAPWTLPAPIGGLISAGGDWMAVVLILVNIGIATLIYLPFVKLYDKKLLREEQGEQVA